MKQFTALAAVIFALVALAHLFRVIRRSVVTISGTEIPMWVSVVAILFAAVMALMLWRESRTGPVYLRTGPGLPPQMVR